MNVAEEMNFKAFQEWLDEPQPNKAQHEPNQPKLSERAKKLMDTLISSAEEDMRTKIAIEVEKIIKRVRVKRVGYW